MQGRPLQNLIKENPLDWRTEVFVQISESQVGRAIRTNKWKYSVRAPHKSGFLFSRSKSYREDFLYDLEHDPHEQYNLVKDPKYEEVRNELATKLKHHMEQAGEEIPDITPKRN
jgi:uncharacterized sulfatase